MLGQRLRRWHNINQHWDNVPRWVSGYCVVHNIIILLYQLFPRPQNKLANIA